MDTIVGAFFPLSSSSAMRCTHYSAEALLKCVTQFSMEREEEEKKGGASFLTFYDCFFALLSCECVRFEVGLLLKNFSAVLRILTAAAVSSVSMLCMTFSLNYPLFHFCQVFSFRKKEDSKFFTTDPFYFTTSSLFRRVIIIMRPFFANWQKCLVYKGLLCIV